MIKTRSITSFEWHAMVQVGTAYSVIVGEREGSDDVSCDVLVGSVQVTIAFPVQILERHFLAEGDRFLWYPSIDGYVGPSHIIPTRRVAMLGEFEFPPLDDEIKRAGSELPSSKETS